MLLMPNSNISSKVSVFPYATFAASLPHSIPGMSSHYHDQGFSSRCREVHRSLISKLVIKELAVDGESRLLNEWEAFDEIDIARFILRILWNYLEAIQLKDFLMSSYCQ